MDKVLSITGASRGERCRDDTTLAGLGEDVCVNYKQSAECTKQLVPDIQDQGVEVIVVQADISGRFVDLDGGK